MNKQAQAKQDERQRQAKGPKTRNSDMNEYVVKGAGKLKDYV